MRKHAVNRWNWSQKAGKWVFVSRERGKRTYKYQDETPIEFINLTEELKQINEKLLSAEDENENKRLFKQMIEVSERLQAMKG